MSVVAELCEISNIVPNLAVRGMEDVCAIFMDLDPRYRIRRRIGVATDMVAPVDNKNAPTELFGSTLCNCRPIESRTGND